MLLYIKSIIFCRARGVSQVFKVGDLVIYGVHGVCRILEPEIKRIDRKNISYYVLEPVDQLGARFYVPSHNEAAVSKLRQLLSEEELYALLRKQETMPDCWISDENQRKQKYKELINSGDRAALLLMVRTLHNQKQEQIAAGKRMHLCDENFMRDAEKLLNSEFALVLRISPGQVFEYIKTKIIAQ